MTVLSEESRKEYVGNGTLDTYVYTWQIYTKDDNKVYVAGVLKTVDIHYTVTGVLNPAGGNIIFTAGNIPANLASIVIYLDLPLTQGIDYKETDKFPAETHERGLDRLTKIVQQFRQVLNRIVKVPISSLLTNLQVPEGAGKLWGWNALGTAPALYNQIIDTGVITTKGDLIVGGNAGIPERKAIGTESQIPEVESGTLAYKDPSHFKLDDWGNPDDNTDLNVSTAKHGLCPKLPNDANKFLNGTGAFTNIPTIKMLATPVNKIHWTATATWADVDISADTGSDTARFAILMLSMRVHAANAGTTIYLGTLRKNGSDITSYLPRLELNNTYALDQVMYTGQSCMVFVELDAGEIFEVQFEKSGAVGVIDYFDIDLIGYIT